MWKSDREIKVGKKGKGWGKEVEEEGELKKNKMVMLSHRSSVSR